MACAGPTITASSPDTALAAIERGKPGVSAAAWIGALWALRLLGDLDPVADPDRDAEGLALENARLRRRARPRTTLDDDF